MKYLNQLFLCTILALGASTALAQNAESSETEIAERGTGSSEQGINWNASPEDIEKNIRGINIQPNNSALIPVVAIAFVFGTPIAITGIIVLGWYSRQKRRLSLMEKIVESGQPIPESLLTNEKAPGSHGSSLRKGITSLGLGAGIIIFGIFVNKVLMAIGAIPLCMGLAYLLLWKLEDKSEKEASDSI